MSAYSTPSTADSAADHEDEHAPRQWRRPQAEGAESDDAVDAGLDQHAGHQRGDAARRGRMGFGQPDVQRDDAGLHAEPHEEQHEDDVAGGTGQHVAREQRREARPMPMRTRG